MPLTRDTRRHERVLLYMIAGVRTAPEFMRPLYEALTRRILDETRWEPSGGLLLPYGDWSRKLPLQLREVWRDIRLPVLQAGSSIGGRAVEEEAGNRWCGEHVLLVGHSGGGVAAVHAAKRLLERTPDLRCAVIQIGSPKCPVPVELQPFTAWFYAARADGRVRDPVCRIGSWREGLLRGGWPSARHPPKRIVPLPIKGGHPDYFRTRLVNDQGRSNLDVTLEAVWAFIRDCWPELRERNG